MKTQYEKECYAAECLVHYRKNYGQHFKEMNLNTWEDVIIAVPKEGEKYTDEYYGKIIKEIEEEHGDGCNYDGGYFDIQIQ